MSDDAIAVLQREAKEEQKKLLMLMKRRSEQALQKQASEYDEKMRALQAQIDQMGPTLARKDEEIQQSVERAAGMESMIAQLKQARGKLKERLDEQDATNGTIVGDLTREVGVLKEMIRHQKNKVDDDVANDQVIAQHVAQIRQLAQQCEELQRNLDEVSSERSSLRQQLSAMQSENEAQQADHGAGEAETIAALRAEIDSMTSSNTHLNDQIAALTKKAAGDAAATKQAIAQHVDQFSKLSRQCEEIQSRLSEATSEGTSLTDQLAAVESEKERLSERIVALEASVADQSANESGAITSLRAEIESMEASNKRNVATLNNQIGGLKKVADDATAHKQAIAEITAQLNGSKLQCDKLQTSLEEASSERASLTEQLAAVESEKDRFSGRIVTLEKSVADHSANEAEVTTSLRAEMESMEALNNQKVATLNDKIGGLKKKAADDAVAHKQAMAEHAAQLSGSKKQCDALHSSLEEASLERTSLNEQLSAVQLEKEELVATIQASAAENGTNEAEAIAALRAQMDSTITSAKGKIASLNDQIATMRSKTAEETAAHKQAVAQHAAQIAEQLQQCQDLRGNLDDAFSERLSLNEQLAAIQSEKEALVARLDALQASAAHHGATEAESMSALRAELDSLSRSSQQKIAALNEQIALLKSKAADSKTAIAQHVAQNSGLTRQCEEFAAEGTALSSQLAVMQSENDALCVRVTALQASSSSHDASESKARAALRAEMDSMAATSKREIAGLNDQVALLSAALQESREDAQARVTELRALRTLAGDAQAVTATAGKLLARSDDVDLLVRSLHDELKALRVNETKNANLIEALQAELDASARRQSCLVSADLVEALRSNTIDTGDVMRWLTADIEALKGDNAGKQAAIDALQNALAAVRGTSASPRGAQHRSASPTHGIGANDAPLQVIITATSPKPKSPNGSPMVVRTPSPKPKSSRNGTLDDYSIKRTESMIVDNDLLRETCGQLRADLAASATAQATLNDRIRSLEQEAGRSSRNGGDGIIPTRSPSILHSLHAFETFSESITSGVLMVVDADEWDAMLTMLRECELSLACQRAPFCESCESNQDDLAMWQQFVEHLLTITTTAIDNSTLSSDGSVDRTSSLEALQVSNSRLKHVLKEQVAQFKKRLAQEGEKVSAMETKWLAEKKKVLQIGLALKKLKAASDAQADNEAKGEASYEQLQAAMERATASETQVAHLTRSFEVMSLAQNEFDSERRSLSAKIDSLTAAVKAEHERVAAIEEEKQRLKSILLRANHSINGTKAQLEKEATKNIHLAKLFDAHWLYNDDAIAEPPVSESDDPDDNARAESLTPPVQFQIYQRCRVDDQWWLMVRVLRVDREAASGAEPTWQKVFWTTIEAFDAHSQVKIVTGHLLDSEKIQDREAGCLSSGLQLPRSIDFGVEAQLKSKFDRKWDSAVRKFEKKVAEMSAEQQSFISQLATVREEFDQYKLQAARVLEERSGSSVRMAELLDEIAALKQERESLQRSMQEAAHDTIDRTNVEIVRLQGQIEAMRGELHQAEVKWAAELQEALIENEKLLSNKQREESFATSSLESRLHAAQEELLRNRASATQLIKERDTAIGELHDRLVKADELARDVARQNQILQAQAESSVIRPVSQGESRRSTTESSSAVAPALNAPIDSTDATAQIHRLQSMLRDAELQLATQVSQTQQVQLQLKKLAQSTDRSGANMDYLKHVIVKYMETDEQLNLLPVISTILAFDNDEVERIRTKLEKSRTGIVIPRMW